VAITKRVDDDGQVIEESEVFLMCAYGRKSLQSCMLFPCPAVLLRSSEGWFRNA